ncbi:hypothetical protein ACFQO1_07625 [Jejudonia soesokkakensis]|uniref:Tetratricopeptide repeat protein n=1 Tax=Jejudonia soesokkakensis TaxID=1323432 RepID=A0ABW2MTX2_9FLAO
MKTIFTSTLLLLLSVITFAQSKYESGMIKAFEQWEAGTMDEAANTFERIASVEKDNWLPAYYVAQLNIIKGFNEKDGTKLAALQEKALNYLNDAKALSKDNPELKVLEAQYYTVWIAHDGQRYGMKYAGKVAFLYAEAAKLAPDNPRVVMGKAEWDMGSAQFFGQSTEPYCKDIERAIALAKNETNADPFYPKFYETRAQEVLADCKK